jgi:N-acetylglucosaminyldiphosphoundecaprenol N-acetyl-beta-D-mannosaminyltransferase
MKQYFKVNLEFNHSNLEKTVIKAANSSKGYCCFVDLNSLVYAHQNKEFRDVLNSSLINSCDGSYIAMLGSKNHGKKLKEYIGPEFFEKFIYKEGKHLILGNTQKVYDKILERIERDAGTSKNIGYLGLPFKDIEDFDYQYISKFINDFEANYIWVSLGAPKQELFMNRLIPLIDKGVLLGVGAAFNYFSGEIKAIPNWVKKTNMIWVYRAFQEPKKQFKRIKTALLVLPQIIKEERQKIANSL